MPRLRLRLRFGQLVSRRSLRSASAAPADDACPICLRADMAPEEAVALGACGHRVCHSCAAEYLRHAAAARRWPIPCVTCASPLSAVECIALLEGAEREALEAVALERGFHGARVRFCCNKRCAAPFEFEESPAAHGTEEGGRVRCPMCETVQCARCGVLPHPGRSCADVRAGESAGLGAGAGGSGGAGGGDGAEDVAMMALAEGWKRCPGCDTYVSKDLGCNHCQCLCGMAFCHRCLTPYLNDKKYEPGANIHGTPGCSCGLFS